MNLGHSPLTGSPLRSDSCSRLGHIKNLLKEELPPITASTVLDGTAWFCFLRQSYRVEVCLLCSLMACTLPFITHTWWKERHDPKNPPSDVIDDDVMWFKCYITTCMGLLTFSLVGHLHVPGAICNNTGSVSSWFSLFNRFEHHLKKVCHLSALHFTPSCYLYCGPSCLCGTPYYYCGAFATFIPL